MLYIILKIFGNVFSCFYFSINLLLSGVVIRDDIKTVNTFINILRLTNIIWCV